MNEEQDGAAWCWRRGEQRQKLTPQLEEHKGAFVSAVIQRKL